MSNLENKKSLPPRIYALAISLDGKILAGSTTTTSFKDKLGLRPIEESFILIWDLTTGKKIRLFSKETSDLIRFLSITSDGKTLLSQTNDGVIKLRSLETGQTLKIIETMASQRFPVVISPDGKMFSSMDTDGTVKFWEMATGKPLGYLKTHRSHTPLAISNDNKTLLMQNAGDVKRFYNLTTGAEVRTLKGSYIESPFATTNGGKYVLLVSARTVQLHELTTGLKIRDFEQIPDGITELVVSPNSQTFLSVGPAGNYHLWLRETGQKLLTLIEGWSRGESVFTPDSNHLINLTWEGNYVTIWNLKQKSLTHQFCINN